MASKQKTITSGKIWLTQALRRIVEIARKVYHLVKKAGTSVQQKSTRWLRGARRRFPAYGPGNPKKLPRLAIHRPLTFKSIEYWKAQEQSN